MREILRPHVNPVEQAATKHPAPAPPDDPPDDDPATMDIGPDGQAVPPAVSEAVEPTASVPQAEPAHKTAQHVGAASTGQRSRPSVPKVGIPRALKTWDHYEVLSLLGAGGMGAVYKARDPRLHRQVAVKIVHPMLGQGPGTTGEKFVKRFLREAQLQASLEHPNICKVYEVGELPGTEDEEGYPYIAMQLITGRPLQRAMAEMSLFEKVRVIQQVAEALHVAHRQGLVHRDIKPANIMIERTDEGKLVPYVMDFGLARETAGTDQSRSGLIEGTPRYMSPEQARGDNKHLDRRTDVYSLGVTLYELISGRFPYEAGGDGDMLIAVMTSDARPMRASNSSIPIDLDAITLKCLEKDPTARYDSAKALADDLGRYLDGEPVVARHLGFTQRLIRRARKHKALVGLGVALFVSLCGLAGYFVRTRLATIERERQSKQQAELAQTLGQEISRMEWLLRSARQLPIHDVNVEKAIVRRQMSVLQSKLASYGSMSKGLANYALGRGHVALHEYQDARRELLQALANGHDTADVHYALGLVLGKHFEQAMHEARLSGGGDWAQKKLADLAPTFLTPAIASLQRSRALHQDSQHYLEALISYYQGKYPEALQHADDALRESPWLYEAAKLAGDVHVTLALLSRDSGKMDEAGRAFAAAVARYEQAASIGRSDAEVYEGLAEAWVRQIEMAANSGKPTESAYAAAIEASDHISIVEPQLVTGRLKKAYAALMTMAISGSGVSPAARVKQCQDEAQAVLERDPENPYARDVAAGCTAFAADSAQGRGEDAAPLFQKAIALLEPAIQKSPNFLWGINDLATTYIAYAAYLQSHGNLTASELFEKSLEYGHKAALLDRKYLTPIQNMIFAFSKMAMLSRHVIDLEKVIKDSDELYDKCIAINHSYQQCHINYAAAAARAAQRMLAAGEDPSALLEKAKRATSASRQLGGAFVDAEQSEALAAWVLAAWRVRGHQDPGEALSAVEAATARALAINPQDAFSKTLQAQGELLRAEWLWSMKRPGVAQALRSAQQAAEQAVRSPELYPDGGQTLAEVRRRQAADPSVQPAARALHLQNGLAALDAVFAINPEHALGRLTQAALLLHQAALSSVAARRKETACAALSAAERGLRADPLLLKEQGRLLSEARTLCKTP